MHAIPSPRTDRASRRRTIALTLCLVILALAPGAAADGDPVPDGLEAALCGSDAQKNAVNSLPGAAGRCATATDYQNAALEGQPSANHSVAIPPEGTPCVNVPQQGFFCPNNGVVQARTQGVASASADPNRTQNVGPVPTPVGTFCVQTCQVPSQPGGHVRLNATVALTVNGQTQTVPVAFERAA